MALYIMFIAVADTGFVCHFLACIGHIAIKIWFEMNGERSK